MSLFLKFLFLVWLSATSSLKITETYMVASILYSIKGRRKNQMSLDEMHKIVSPQKHNQSFALNVSFLFQLFN